MLHTLKKRLYFTVAAYFAFWAKFVLLRWKPRIVVVTGSSGKTTLLHLIEAQFGDQAVYSHHANSAIGIPFHILGLGSNVPSKAHWLKYFLIAPFCIFRRLPHTKIYVVEADCDRPREGAFTARLLKPEITLWISVYNTHSMNFDGVVRVGRFETHEAAIADEFGNFLTATTKLIIANGDQPELVKQLPRAARDVMIKQVSTKNITNYKVTETETVFELGNQTIYLSGLHPKDTGMSLQMVDELAKYLDIQIDPLYGGLELPPGRSNILSGKNDITIIDSTYNTGLGAAIAVMELFSNYPSSHKWLVVADILEQGSIEKDEHQKLAEVISKTKFERIILLGNRTRKYTYPILQQKMSDVQLASFEKAGDVLDYLTKELKGHETVLFKGAQGLEGVIEQLLDNPDDAKHLVRRESFWTKRRQQWGLPK